MTGDTLSKRILGFGAAGILLGTSVLGLSTATAGPDMGWHPPAPDAFAGPGMPPGPGMGPVDDGLDLSEEQQAKIEEIIEESVKQHQKLDTDTQTKIDAVLTDEQKAERDARMEGRMDRQLDLTDEQVAKIEALFEAQKKDPELAKSGIREKLAEILTEDQLAKMHDRGPMPGHQRPMRPEPPRQGPMPGFPPPPPGHGDCGGW